MFLTNMFWGYVAVCVQLYCRWFTVLCLIVAVLHYMFLPTWPSSSVYDVLLLYSWRNLLHCFCCPFLHMVTLCTFSSVGWVKYDVLLFIITYPTFYAIFLFCYNIYIFTYLCISAVFFVNFLILVCVFACLPFLVVCLVCAAICCLFRVVKHHTHLKMAM
jgi:hypothetical protein